MGLVGERSVLRSVGSTAVSVDLVGREVELAHLREALDAACAGEGGVVFLVGEAGIGKSRLAEAVAADAAARGLPTLRGRAIQTATPAPYRPLAEALSSAVRAGIAPDLTEVRPFRAILGRLVPEWRRDDHGPLDESQVAVAEAVLRLLRATAGESGVVLVLEDLHWADPETVTAVEYLADNLGSERVLCVVTVREGHGGKGTDLAEVLRCRRAAPVLHLAPLTGREVTAMVASCLGAATISDDVVALAARAEGVPFIVEELLTTAVSTGALVQEAGSWTVAKRVEAVVPATFAESIRRRLGELGDDGERVVVAAAVLGRQFDWGLLPAITDLGDDVVLRALHQAVDARIISWERDDGAFRFRHALSRDAVLATLFTPELQAVARRALEAVEAGHPDLEGEWGELAAELAGAAGDYRRAATLLVAAGRRAFRQGALATVEAMLDRARELLPATDPASLDVDEFLLEVLSLAGKGNRAGDVARSLIDRLGAAPKWARRRAKVNLRLARAAVVATKWDDARRHLEHARDELSTAPDEELSASIDVVAAQVAVVRDPAEAPTLARAALAAAESLGLPEVACEALEVLGRVQRPADLVAAEDAFDRAVAIAESNRLALWRARAVHELGAIDMLRGRPVGRLEEARELALRLGALATAAVVDVQIAAALVIADDPRQGVEAARRAAEVARRYRFDQTLAAALALEAYGHARWRDRAGMQRCIDEAHAVAAGVPDIEVKTATAAALLALIQEDRAAARHLLCSGLQAAARGGDYSVVPAVGMLAVLRALDGGDDRAPDIAIPAWSVHFLAGAYLKYAAAIAAGRAGDGDRALALVEDADRILEGHRWFGHLGRRLVAEAAITDGWGAPSEWLSQTLRFFDEGGEGSVASACRSLLRRTGVAVPRRRAHPGVPDELRALGVTARELEVFRLLALGQSNKDIAARLYLSPRTVERHVANVMVKTGAKRRSELVAFAARTVGSKESPA
jgi:DNA-binding CsgD family transcriptional regulator/tetratricopeptide (TPR) repeat protein